MINLRAALLSVGGLLLAAVLGAALPTHGDWVPFATLLGLLAIGGAVVISLPQVRRRVRAFRPQGEDDAMVRSRLAEALTTCRGLMAGVALLTDQVDQIADVRSRAEQWGRETVAYLDRERPGWSAVFMSDPVASQFVSQYTERDIVRNWLHHREAALRQLLSLLG